MVATRKSYLLLVLLLLLLLLVLVLVWELGGVGGGGGGGGGGGRGRRRGRRRRRTETAGQTVHQVDALRVLRLKMADAAVRRLLQTIGRAQQSDDGEKEGGTRQGDKSAEAHWLRCVATMH